ncbi:MAG: hypothetical protein V3575_04870 [Candidatus Absconditabacteria bacterium]
MSKTKIEQLNKINFFENPSELTQEEFDQLQNLAKQIDKDPNYLSDLPTAVLDQFMKSLELHIGGFMATDNPSAAKKGVLLELFTNIGNKLKGIGLNFEDYLGPNLESNLIKNYQKNKDKIEKQSRKDLGKLMEEIVDANNKEFLDRVSGYISALNNTNGDFVLVDKSSNPKIIFKDKHTKKEHIIVPALPKYGKTGQVEGLTNTNSFLVGSNFEEVNRDFVGLVNAVTGRNSLDLKYALSSKVIGKQKSALSKAPKSKLNKDSGQSIMPGYKIKKTSQEKVVFDGDPTGFTYKNGEFYVRADSGITPPSGPNKDLIDIPGINKKNKKTNSKEVDLSGLNVGVGKTDNESYSIELKAKSERIADKQVQILGAYVKKIIQLGKQQGGLYLDFETSLQGKQYQKLLGGVIVDVGSKARLNISVQDLYKLETLNFSKSGQSREFLAHQMNAGFELNYWMGNFINKLGLAGVYGKSDNKSFGVLSSTITETNEYVMQNEIRGFFQGATTYEGKVTMDFKLADWLKLETALGLEHLKYNDLGKDAMGLDIETDDNSKTGVTYGARLTGQFDDGKTEAYLGFEHDLSGNEYKGGVSRYLTKGVKLGVEGGYNDPFETGRDPEWKVAALISIAFGGPTERHSKLFTDKKKTKDYLDKSEEDNQSETNMPELSLRDLRASSGVDKNRISGRAWEHELKLILDKTKGFTYEADEKGKIKLIKMPGSPNLIPGDNPLSTNPSGLESLFQVQPDLTVGITYQNALELFKRTDGKPVIMNFRETGGTNYVLDVQISIGSMHFDAALNRGGISPEFAQEIVKRKVHPAILEGLLNNTLNVITAQEMHFVTGYFNSSIVANYTSGYYSHKVMNGVQEGRYPADWLVFLTNKDVDNPTAEAYLESALDSVPDAYSFIDVTNVPLNTEQISNEVTITGLIGLSNLSIIDGEYSIDGGPWSSAPTTISNNQKVRVRHTSTSAYNSNNNTYLNIGGVEDVFTSTTVAETPLPDTTPDTFTFLDVSGADLSTEYTESIVVSGVDSPTPVSIENGEYSINGGVFTTDPGTVNNGDTITVRLTSSNLNSTNTSAKLTVGGVFDNFDITTKDAALDLIPDAFTFNSVSNASINTLYTSNTNTIAGINGPSPISVTGGEYSINGGAFTSDAGVINNGDTVAVRLTTGAVEGETRAVLLTVGGYIADYEVTTLSNAPILTFNNKTTTGSSISTEISSDKVGTGYYILSTNSAPMAPADIKNNGTSMNLVVGNNPLTINNVNSDTTYYLHYVAENTSPTPVLGIDNNVEFTTGVFTGTIESNSGTLYAIYENKDVNFNLTGPALANCLISFNDGGSQATGLSLVNGGNTARYDMVYLTRIANIKATITGQTFNGNTVKYVIDVPSDLSTNPIDPTRYNTAAAVDSGDSVTWNITYDFLVDGVPQANDPNREGLAFINADTVQPSQGTVTVDSSGQVTFDATGVTGGTYTATIRAASYVGSLAEITNYYDIPITIEVTGVDNEPPLAPTSLTILGGVEYVNDPFIVVDVNHSNPGDVAGYFVSESNVAPAVDNPNWSGSSSILLNLSEPDGLKTLYGFVKDANGNVQPTSVSGTITLDRVPLSTFNWIAGVSDQNTFYADRIIEVDGDIGTANLSSKFGGTISNVRISGNRVTFDYATPSVEEDFVELSVTDLAGNLAEVEVSTGIIF